MKKNRSTLKDCFKKGAIPTEANFADLIDSMLNQEEDNIGKPPDAPLKIIAAGDDEALIDFYRQSEEKPSWQVKQKTGGKPGLSFGDATASRLFIESDSGNVGIGTTTPAPYRLNVTGSALFTGDYLFVNSESAGRLRVGAAWGMPGLFSGDDGAKDLILGVPEGRKVYLGIATGDAYVEGGTGNTYLKGNLGIGTTTLDSYRLNVAGNALFTGNYLFVNSESAGRLRVGAAWGMPGLYSSDDGAKDLILGVPEGRKVYLGTATGDAYVEGGTGNAYLKGNLGLGTSTPPKTKLRVEGGDISTTGNLCTERGRLAFSNVIGDANHTIYNNGFDLDKEGAWDGLKMNVYAGLDVRVGEANGKKPASALRVDSAGYLATKQVYFSAYVDLNTSSGALNPLPMKVASQNIGNCYDINTSKFTAPVKGVYLFTMTGLRSEGTGDLLWFLLVNGNYANAGGTSAAESGERCLLSWYSNNIHSSRTIILSLNSGDAVWVQQTGTGRCDNFRSGLEGVLLSATL